MYKRFALVILIILCLTVVLFTNIPHINALANKIQLIKSAQSGGTSLTTTYNNTVNHGDLLVDVGICEHDNLDNAVTSVSDTLNNIWTPVNSTYPNGQATNNPAVARVVIFTALTVLSGSDTVTLHCTNTMTTIWNFIYEFNGVGSINGTSSQFQTGTGTGTMQTGHGATFSGNTILIAGIFGASVSNVNWTPGTGYTGYTGSCCETVTQYALSGVTSPTQFPSSTSGNGQWNIAGVAIEYTPQSNTIITVTSYTYVTVTVTPNLSKCTDTNSCTTNQFSQFMIVLLPSLIIIALLEYFPYKMGVKDERVYVLIFMCAVSAVGFLSALGGFGQNGIPWYIPIFSDIVGFMLIIAFKGNNGGSF